MAHGENRFAAISLEAVASFENLYLAYTKAARGKMKREDVAKFAMQWEKRLLDLRRLLLSATYVPGKYRLLTVHEKKTRIIMAAPFTDRIVHHAICNVLNPELERSMHPNSCANRIGKGTRRGLELFSRHAAQYAYVLKCDIRSFFPSINRDIAFGLLRPKVKDPKLLDLIKSLLDTPPDPHAAMAFPEGREVIPFIGIKRGLPIGNMTSQTWANWYLNGLDHFITSFKGFGAYVRYVDDFAVFSDNKQALHDLKAEIERYLEKLKLTLHSTKSRVYRTSDGAAFLGFRHFRGRRVLNKSNIKRFKRKLREKLKLFRLGGLSKDGYRSSVAGWCGHARMGNTYRLREHLYFKICRWNRGLGEWTSCSAWGLLEQ